MAVNPSYALQFQRLLGKSSEPRKTRSTGTVTAVSSDSAGKIANATISTGGGLLSVPVPYGTNVYTGMAVSVINEGTPSNAQWRLYGTTAIPGGIQGGSIINHDGNTFAMFDSIWVRGDGTIIVGGDVDLDGDPTGPRVESNQYGYFGYDQYDRLSLAIYAANSEDNDAGDILLGPSEGSRISILPNDGTIEILRNGVTSLEFSADGNFIRDPLVIGNPVGARINLGEIENKATLVLRDSNGVAKMVARTSDTDSVYVHIGNPPPEDNSMWFDSADGRLSVNGHVTMQSMDVRGRATFSSTGSFLIADPDDPGRFGVTTPRGQYAYTTNSLGETHLIRVDAWGPLVLEDVLGSGEWRTWVGGSQIFGDPRYRHFRIERGATARAGLFNGETPVAYMDQAGKGYFTGEVTMESGVVNGDVLITDGGVLTFDAISGKFNGGGIRWEKSGTEYLRIGTQVDLGSVVGNIVDSHTVDLSLYSDGSIYIIPGAGQQTIIGGVSYGESGSNYTAFSRTGDITLAGTATFTSPNGIIGPTWKPASDSTTALQIQQAGGTAILTVDTTNRRMGVNRTPTAARLEFQGLTASEQLLSFYDSNSNGRLVMFDSGNMFCYAVPSTSGDTYKSSPSFIFNRTRWNGSASVDEGFSLGHAAYDGSAGRSALWFQTSAGGVPFAISNGTYGQVAINYAFPADALISLGQFILRPYDASTIGQSIWMQASQTANAFQTTDSSGTARTQILASGAIDTSLENATTAAADTILRLSHNTSGTAANGFGSRVLFELESSTTADQTAAALEAAWTTATHASRAGRLSLYGSYAGTFYEAVRAGAVSGAAALGFYGVTAIARPTTSSGAASFTANSGTAVNDASTFDGYTLKQVVKALRDVGLLT